MLENKLIKKYIALINNKITAIQKSPSKSIKHLLAGSGLKSGKRLRGALVMLTAQANGAKTGDKILNIATAIEILHNATLIHDDIVDDSGKRRGIDSLNKKAGAALSVLTGDYLFAYAMETVVNSVDNRLLSIFAGAIKDVCEGEIEEVHNKYNISLSIDGCVGIIRKKTASLIRGSVLSGGYLGNCTPEAMKHLGVYAENLGIAFQIKDDLLDIISKTSKIGKSAGNDLKEGKPTLPLILAIQNAPAKESSKIKRLFRANSTESARKRILDFIFANGGVNLAGLMAMSYVTDAKAALDKAKLKDDKKKELLYEIADYVLEREF